MFYRNVKEHTLEEAMIVGRYGKGKGHKYLNIIK